MKKNQFLKIKHNSEPLTDSFVPTRKNIEITIGNTHARIAENVLYSKDYPEVISMIAKFVPKKEFDQKVSVIGKYEEYKSERIEHSMRFTLYNGSHIDMKNFVSGFEILFEYFDPDQLVSGQIPEAWQMFMENSRTIYAQDFATQMKSSNLKTFEIEHKFASKLYPFAGYFGDGASPKDIQQHFFFISNKNDEESFIKTVSSSEYLKKDIKQAAKTVLNPEYTKSLADIVVSGGIKLSFPDEIGKTSEYESISIKRNTNSSSMLKIYFREKE